MSDLHLHHLENSRSFRILWLLEELNQLNGLEYQLTRYERTSSYLAPKKLTEVHSNGKVPILEVRGLADRDDSTITPITESGHIIDYLMAKYDTEYVLHPNIDPDSQAWLDYDFWMHYAEGSAMPPLVLQVIFNKVVERAPTLIKPVAKGIRKQVAASIITKSLMGTLAMIERHLSSNRWFAGAQFSAVDIQMAFVIEAMNAGGGLDSVRYLNIINWLQRCQLRPAYKLTVEKGGKLDF